MAPKKAKTAFLYYQSQFLALIRNELNCGMGEAMTTLSQRWRDLSQEERAPFLEMEQQDRDRFEHESAEADQEAIAVVEARRQNLTMQDGEQSSSRGARARIDQERAEKETRREKRRLANLAAMDPEEVAERERQAQLKKQETEDRRKIKRDEERALAKQHHKLDKEEAHKASKRLEYLLKQSSIFAKLSGGSHETLDQASAPSPSTKPKQREPGVHHIHASESAEEEEEEEEVENHIFLSKQPSIIKFGQLKPYQLEGLNWMIHLAEKGLNGILADEMGLGKTLQSISIMAYHWEFLRCQGPHLVCVPKSTLSNWMNELKRWCPCLRVIKFHGSREEREYIVDNFFTNEAASHDGRRPDKQIYDGTELVDDNTDNPRTWDVCVTTYEVANNEKRALQKFPWYVLQCPF
jgi:SWI/SNF-related matrix-associated actin-dependent regulator of chromatin subfamily A member 5